MIFDCGMLLQAGIEEAGLFMEFMVLVNKNQTVSFIYAVWGNKKE